LTEDKTVGSWQVFSWQLSSHFLFIKPKKMKI